MTLGWFQVGHQGESPNRVNERGASSASLSPFPSNSHCFDQTAGTQACADSCFSGRSRSSDRIRMVLSTPPAKVSVSQWQELRAGKTGSRHLPSVEFPSKQTSMRCALSPPAAATRPCAPKSPPTAMKEARWRFSGTGCTARQRTCQRGTRAQSRSGETLHFHFESCIYCRHSVKRQLACALLILYMETSTKNAPAKPIH